METRTWCQSWGVGADYGEFDVGWDVDDAFASETVQLADTGALYTLDFLSNWKSSVSGLDRAEISTSGSEHDD